MRLSCLPVSLYPALSSGDLQLREWFELAASLGLDGADVSVAHLATLEDAYLRSVRAQAEEAGVRIAMLVTYSDFTHPFPAERAFQVEKLGRQIDAASELGAEFVRVTAGQVRPGVGVEEGITWAASGLTAHAERARQAGIALVYENHTRGYGWTQNDFSQPAEIFLEIVRQTEGTPLGVLFDTANSLAHGDDPVAVIHSVKHRTRVMHINDIRRPGHFEPVLLGSGVAPIQQLLEVMVETGFDDWISVEEASGLGPAGLRKAIPEAERLWALAGGTPRQR